MLCKNCDDYNRSYNICSISHKEKSPDSSCDILTPEIQCCFGNFSICKNPNCPQYKLCLIKTMEIDMKLEVRG